METMNEFNNQERFVELLAQLTEAGEAKWVQREHDQGFVFCLVKNELIEFEVRGNQDADYVRPSEEVTGVLAKFRNVQYLWLEGLPGWDTLLSLLKKAPIDDKEYNYFCFVTETVPLQVLEDIVIDLPKDAKINNLNFEKAGKYIQLFDCMKKVVIGDHKLKVTFECLNGGIYEGIRLDLIFICPYVYKMPYFQEGNFTIELVKLENQEIIEDDWIEGFEKLFLIKNKERNLDYYVLCDEIDIFVAGNNCRVINNRELLID